MHGLVNVLLCACVSVCVSCECVFGYVYIICMYVYVMYIGVHVCVCIRVYVRVSSWVGLRVAVFRIRLVRSGLLQETRTLFGFVLVVDPMHRRFKDRSMG